SVARPRSGTMCWFAYWMAVQGLFQAFTQLAIGSLLPGNDVGRALSYLHLDAAARWGLFALALAAMGFFGNVLFGYAPATGGADEPPSRAFAYATAWPLLASIALIIPSRAPRDVIEMSVVPLLINLAALGWLVLGAALSPRARSQPSDPAPALIGPA